MPRTQYGNLLKRLQAEADFAHRAGLPVADVHDVVQQMSRRRFLKGSIGLGAATLLPALGCSSDDAAGGGNAASGSGMRVAVVGAGLAGLTCAHRLARAGANVTVYEASDRLGGRTRTVRGFFGDNRTAESGAEFVGSNHAAIRALIQELGLELEDLWTGYPDGTSSVTSFDRAPYSRTDIANDWSAVAPAVRRDYAAAGTDIRWDNHTDAAIGLDRMSLAQWIDANVPGGRPSRMGRLIEITQLSEWAGAAEHQSALNFITTVGPGAGGAIDQLAGSDERWHVIGGSDLIAQRLGEQIGPAAIQLGARLAAVRPNGAGALCTFDQAGTPVDVAADRVVLAVPFSTLRAVDLDGVGLSDRKRRVIAEQPMGTNSKLHLEFGERAWRNDGTDGDSISDTGLMVTWEGVITEPGPTGVLVAYSGGALGAGYDVNVAHAEAQPAIVSARASSLETVFGPATAAAVTGRGWLDSWFHDPFVGGSYSYWSVGQYTELRGAAGTPEGPLHFCGEHTSLEHQGFMNGAVETGERAANEILGTAP